MTPEQMKHIDKLIEAGDVVEVSLQNTAKLVHLLEAMRDENMRLRKALKTIITASEFYSQEGLADYLMRYAHESTFRLAKQALKGEGDE